MSALMARRATWVAVVGLIVTLGSPASAQYFGRNKVRYRTFHFQSKPISFRRSSPKGRAGSPNPSGAVSSCRSRGPIGDTNHVIGHELVHGFQFDVTRALPGQSGDMGLSRLPLSLTTRAFKSTSPGFSSTIGGT